MVMVKTGTKRLRPLSSKILYHCIQIPKREDYTKSPLRDLCVLLFSIRRKIHMDIKNTLLTNLQKLAKQHTEETLGDRSNYLGASDIGNCPRKVILEKINPSEHDLATLLRFERGHMTEDIIAKVFTAAGYKFERQVEIEVDCDTPVTVHIDFVFTDSVKKIKSILEVKSTRVPDEPYSSWESQLYLQMGALAEQFPDYTIRGAFIALDLQDGDVGFFNSYTPNETLFNGLIERAGTIWSHYQAMLRGNDLVREGVELELKTEVSPLCGFCNHIESCPRFEADEVPELAEDVNTLRNLQEEEKILRGKISPHKAKLFRIVEKKGSVKSAGYILKKATRNRKHTDFERLEAFLADHGSSLSEFQENRPFSFLEVKKAKAA